MHFEEFIQQWKDSAATAIQIALLTRIASALRSSPDCMGAVIVGSFAKGSADRLSDIDLVAFCPEGAGRSLFEAIRQQIALSDALFTFDGARDPDSPYQKLVFDDFTSMEFHIISPSIELTLEQPFVEIVNRDGCIEARTSSRLAPTEHDMTVFYDGGRFLAWELFTCLKWLWRGDFKTAKRYLIELGKAIEASERDLQSASE